MTFRSNNQSIAAQPPARPHPHADQPVLTEASPTPPVPAHSGGGPFVDGLPRRAFMFAPVPSRSGTPHPVDLAAALAELTGLIVSSSGGLDHRSVGTVVGDAGTELITGAEQGGIVTGAALEQYRTLDNTAASELQLLSKAQDHTGQGPFGDAAGGGVQVIVHDLRTDTRWPTFTARSPWEVRSLLCTPLAVSGRAAGVLAVLSTKAWAFDDTSARLASVVAAHTALALTHAQQVRNLTAMAHSRDVIGQAKGILMAQHHLTAEQAYQILSRASQDRNVKLAALCQTVADTGEIPTTTTTRRRTVRRSNQPQ